jgi:hypothetical protein
MSKQTSPINVTAMKEKNPLPVIANCYYLVIHSCTGEGAPTSEGMNILGYNVFPDGTSTSYACLDLKKNDVRNPLKSEVSEYMTYWPGMYVYCRRLLQKSPIP